MDHDVYDSTLIHGTPFHPRTAPLNRRRRWVVWDRRAMVEVYSDYLAEYGALREAAGLLDMSPLSKTRVSGPEAERFVNRVITRDAAKLAVHQVYYSPLVNEQGLMTADGIVFRLEPNSFVFSTDPIYNWLAQNATGYEVEISDITNEYGILSLQGPRSAAVLEAATGHDMSGLKFSRHTQGRVAGALVEILRQGFTGERGYELWVPAAEGVAVWDALMEAGRPVGMLPCGNTVMDVARLEAGLLIVGPDYTSARVDRLGTPMDVSDDHRASPFELGLGDFVDFGKGDFIGREALWRQQQQDCPGRRLVGLELDWLELANLYASHGLAPDIPWRPRWNPLPLVHAGQLVGRATSVGWSPALKKLIGFGHVEPQFAIPGAKLQAEWSVSREPGLVPAVIVELPFHPSERT